MNSETATDPLWAATQHAELGLPLTDRSRVSFARHAVVRVTQFFTSPQRAYNRGMVDCIHMLRDSTEELRLAMEATRAHAAYQAEDHERIVAELRSDLGDLQLTGMAEQTRGALIEGQLVGISDDVQRLEAMVSGVSLAVRELDRLQTDQHQRERSQQSVVDLFLREVRRQYPAPPDAERLAALPNDGDDLYEALEDAFRGSFDDVQERLRVYLPDLALLSSGGRILDVGTGRGEWLELLANAGIEAYGVDTNAKAVERCRERGLEVVHADALEHMATLPEASLAAVTGFHVAEHISFEALLELIDNAVRVLRPGGLLILETPNPMNLIVGAASFYLDPTHQRPLHPFVIEFLLSARGFTDVELRYLHPNSSSFEWSMESEHILVKPLQPIVDRLNDILFGPQDFAVLGHRVAT